MYTGKSVTDKWIQLSAGICNHVQNYHAHVHVRVSIGIIYNHTFEVMQKDMETHHRRSETWIHHNDCRGVSKLKLGICGTLQTFALPLLSFA